MNDYSGLDSEEDDNLKRKPKTKNLPLDRKLLKQFSAEPAPSRGKKVYSKTYQSIKDKDKLDDCDVDQEDLHIQKVRHPPP